MLSGSHLLLVAAVQVCLLLDLQGGDRLTCTEVVSECGASGFLGWPPAF